MSLLSSNSGTSVCIIGAGVIGCAIAYELGKAGYTITVIDANAKPGQGITSRNSEIIHAGMYYPTDSLKAKLCVEGRILLYDYCKKFNVAHKQTGKIIIASSDQEIEELEKINQQALANGITSLRFLSKSEVAALEPHVVAHGALLSPETGIISAHDFCTSLETHATNSGVTFAFQTLVTGLTRSTNGWKIQTQEIRGVEGVKSALPYPQYSPAVSLNDLPYSFSADYVINSAGLYADWVSALAGVDPSKYGYELTWVKGEYFSLSAAWGKKLSHLVYPVPEKNIRGLGVHVTLDIGGQAKLGPNVIEMNRIEDYSIDATHREAFFHAAKKYLPSLSISDIAPAYAGIRPKLSKAGEKARDFVITEESPHGAARFINLIGIESPGLTSALAIGKHIRTLIELL